MSARPTEDAYKKALLGIGAIVAGIMLAKSGKKSNVNDTGPVLMWKNKNVMDNTQQKQETRKVKPTQQVEVQSKGEEEI